MKQLKHPSICINRQSDTYLKAKQKHTTRTTMLLAIFWLIRNATAESLSKNSHTIQSIARSLVSKAMFTHNFTLTIQYLLFIELEIDVVARIPTTHFSPSVYIVSVLSRCVAIMLQTLYFV